MCASEADAVVLPPIWTPPPAPRAPTGLVSSHSLLLAFLCSWAEVPVDLQQQPAHWPQPPQPPSAFCSPRVFQNTEDFPQKVFLPCHLSSILSPFSSPRSVPRAEDLGLSRRRQPSLLTPAPGHRGQGCNQYLSRDPPTSRLSTCFLTHRQASSMWQLYQVFSVFNGVSKNDSCP